MPKMCNGNDFNQNTVLVQRIVNKHAMITTPCPVPAVDNIVQQFYDTSHIYNTQEMHLLIHSLNVDM
jgi:hypothetical protein